MNADWVVALTCEHHQDQCRGGEDQLDDDVSGKNRLRGAAVWRGAV